MKCPFRYKLKNKADKRRYGRTAEVMNKLVELWWDREGEKQLIRELTLFVRTGIYSESTLKPVYRPK